MIKEFTALFHPVCFGAQKCRSNKVRLHSHLGECFAGNYAINKLQHYIFGQHFAWMTDCYAVKFLLSYKGSNPAILCPQMHLMCWDVNILHCPDSHLVNADNWSHLGAEIDFGPLFCDYLQYTMELQKSHSVPTDLLMRPKNMPYYRGPCFRPQPEAANPNEALHVQTLLTDILTLGCDENMFLSNVPVCFGHILSRNCSNTTRSCTLLNSKFTSYAFQAMYFNCRAVNPSLMATSLPQSNHVICPSMSVLPAIHLSRGKPSSINLHRMLEYLIQEMTC
jgi:hypothetical protein